MPYLIFLFVCLVWSVSFMLMKKAGLAFSPAEIGLWRVVAGAATLGVLWFARDRQWSLRRGDTWPMIWVMLAGCAWPYFIQPWVIARQGSAFMALMVSFVPLLTILLALPVLRVKPSTRQFVGVVGSLVCLAILMGDGLGRRIPWIDLLMALTVPSCYAAANIVIRLRLAHAQSLLVTLVALTSSIVVLLPVATVSNVASTVASEVWWVATAALVFLGIVGTGIATYLFNKLIRDHGPLFAGMTTNLVPLGAVLFGWLDAEHVSLAQCGALVGIVVMVTLVQYRAASRRE